MTILRYLLLPFAGLYNLITRVRNHLFDIGHKKSFQFDTVVISVGNLNVGGSGKTPMIEYLIRLLIPYYKVATLSRGYGRRTSGYRTATDKDTARTIGDEPFQMFRKYGESVVVAVGEERALAIPSILLEHPEVQIILLDDAFQHRSVVPQFSILVTDIAKPFYKDFLLPFGRLREARKGATRANAIVVTKCNNISLELEQEVRTRIKQEVGEKPVFFSQLTYQSPVAIHHDGSIAKRVILVSGIGNSNSLEEFVKSNYELVRHFRYPDHHVYTSQELDTIHGFAKSNQVENIITTEKDMVKLIANSLTNQLNACHWFYLPIHAGFVKDGAEFDVMIKRLVESRIKEIEQAD